ncbi:MAG TPA: DnaJ domain-containing protein [Pyrinomonadaceae bacterium]|nr:DnaJ domain-containing protein [Pyrinomonadaceae bacterium]
MNGRLSDHPLAELIREISDTRLSGALRLEHERAKAVVYFDAGDIAVAVSNARALRLVEVLRRSGLVDAGRIYAAVGEGLSDEQAGVELVRAGVLDESGLRRLQERQSKEVLGEALRWPGGEWKFDARVRLAGGQALRLDVSGLLAESARNLPPGFVAARVRDDAQTVAPAEGFEERMSSGLRLLPAEAFVMSRVYAPTTLGEVVAVSGLPGEETRRAVYVLALAGLLKRTGGTRILPAEAQKLAAQQLAAAAAAAAAPKPEPEPTRQTPEPEPDKVGTVEELLALAGGATHYEVLGVTRSASTDEVKRVYYSHARRLHPDRFRRDADEETRQRIDAAFARIAQAYDVLRDSALRAAYDLKLAKKRQ